MALRQERQPVDFPRKPERARHWLVAFATPALLTASLAVVLLDSAAAAAAPVQLRPSAAAVPAATTKQLGKQISVPRAPMGWASWNGYFSSIDHKVIKAEVDAIVSSRLGAAGYTYVNLDDGWWQGERDGSGNIVVDKKLWPGGMKAIANYIHSKGLKAGIYTDAGHNGCGYHYPTTRPAAPNTGSAGHYEQDMLQFQRWGFDMVKVDWCGGQVESLDQETTYRAISDAIAKATAVTHRQLILSICEWGTGKSWNWAPGVAPMWRTSHDIFLYHERDNPNFSKVLSNFDQSLHPTSQHTGFYNDPDMMMVGMDGVSEAQSRTHMSLWAVAGAPLLIGDKPSTMDAATRKILTNREVIAVAQDPRGLPAVEVAEDALNQQVYAKVLAGTGRRAVALLNRTSAAAKLTVRWKDLGLTDAAAKVRDVWTGTAAGNFATGYSVSVPAGEAMLLTVAGTEADASRYEAEATGNTWAGSAAPGACANCSGRSNVRWIGNGSASTLRFNDVSANATGLAVATIAYANGGPIRTATLQVNGQRPTKVSFPSTGSWRKTGTVSVVVSLAKGGDNAMTFGNATGWAPHLDAVEVRELAGTAGTQLVGAESGRCVDIADNGVSNDTQAQLYDCTGGSNQTWTHTARQELVLYGNKCLDAAGTGNGTRVIIWECHGQTNQQWNINADGTISSAQSGLCLDAEKAGTGNGTRLLLWECNGQRNQQWTRN